jgi:nucleoside-diphosphate-sugar epimerase
MYCLACSGIKRILVTGAAGFIGFRLTKLLISLGNIFEVLATWANAGLLNNLTGHKPTIPFKDGIKRFVAWFRDC